MEVEENHAVRTDEVEESLAMRTIEMEQSEDSLAVSEDMDDESYETPSFLRTQVKIIRISYQCISNQFQSTIHNNTVEKL